MLFITNRRVEGPRRSQAGRPISFAASDNEPGASLFFCQRQGPEQYIELTAMPFFGRLRRSTRRQVLFFVHGFNCQPEARIFPDALRLQKPVRVPWRRSWSRWSRWCGRATTISGSCSITGTTSRRPPPAASPWRGP